jgi:hypothetical protein
MVRFVSGAFSPFACAAACAASFAARRSRNSSRHLECTTCSTRTWMRFLATRPPICRGRRREEGRTVRFFFVQCEKRAKSRDVFAVPRSVGPRLETHLLVKLHTNGTRGDVPHDASAALVRQVRHTLLLRRVHLDVDVLTDLRKWEENPSVSVLITRREWRAGRGRDVASARTTLERVKREVFASSRTTAAPTAPSVVPVDARFRVGVEAGASHFSRTLKMRRCVVEFSVPFLRKGRLNMFLVPWRRPRLRARWFPIFRLFPLRTRAG